MRRKRQGGRDARVWRNLTEAQRGRLGFLWKEKQRLDSEMENRGRSFIRILEFVAAERAADR